MNCQYEVVYADRKDLMKSKPCDKPADKTGFCSEHQYCYELLALGQALDYPGFSIDLIDRKTGELHPVLIVQTGKPSWETYALRHPKRRHDWLMTKLRKQLKDRLAKAA